MKRNIINNILFVSLIFILFYFLFINTNKLKEGNGRRKCNKKHKWLKYYFKAFSKINPPKKNGKKMSKCDLVQKVCNTLYLNPRCAGKGKWDCVKKMSECYV